MKNISMIWICLTFISCFSQRITDTVHTKDLDEVIIRSWMRCDFQRMADEQNGILTSGKKNEIIILGTINGNIAIKSRNGSKLFSNLVW